MGIDLTYQCIDGNQYQVTVSFYRDCYGIPAPSSFFIDISSASCGQSFSLTVDLTVGPTEVSQLCDAQISNSTCVGGTMPGVEQYIYSDTVYIPMQCTDWTFSTSECCRNAMITNLVSPDSYEMYVEATLNNTVDSCNDSPIFTNLPVPYICNNRLYNYNHGAVDMDGDSLVYTLVNPLSAGAVTIPYNSPYSPTYPIATTTGTVGFDPLSGQFTVTPNGLQVCVVTFLVEEYRNGVLIGTTMRDMQIVVLNCGPTDPYMSSGGIVNFSGGWGGQLLDSNAVTICVGENLSFQIEFADTLDSLGEVELITNLDQSIPGAVYATTGFNPKTFYFDWTPGIFDLGMNYFTITATGDECPIKVSHTYVFNIYVRLATYAGEDKYLCEDDTMQLYAIGGDNFTWTPNVYISDTSIQNPYIWPDTDMTYVVISDLTGQCKNIDSIKINVVNDFALSATADITICYGGSVQLGATTSPPAAYSYVWAPAAGLNDDSIANPMASPAATTTYILSVSHPNGCIKQESVVVTVNPVPLTVDPTADDDLLCLGDSTVLHANPITGSCTDYLVASIPYSPPASGGYTTISSIMFNEVVSGSIYIGFDFEFFCNWYDQVYVSSNGWLSFTSQASAASNCQSLPDATTPNNIIAFAWANLNPGAGSPSIGYKITGTSPNQVFILKFENVQHYFSSNSVTVYVKLFESSNIIEIHNQAITNDGSFKTQGIENATGTIAYEIPGHNYSIWTAYGTAYRFTPLIPPPYTLTWYDPSSNPLGNNVDITVSPDSVATYSLVITDGICVDQKNVTLNVVSFKAGPDVMVCPGDSAQLTTLFSSNTLYLLPSSCGIASSCSGSAGIANYPVGTGSGSNSNTSWPAPYGNWYRNAKHQFLFTAAELTGAGIIGGTVTALAWYVSSIQGTSTYYSYTIKMGCTSIGSLTTWQSGLTTVFTPKTVNLITGWNNHNLDFDFNWDGVSNIIVEICYNNLAYSYTYNSISPYTNTGFSSCVYDYSDSNPMCPSTSPPQSTSNRPNTRFTVCLDSLTNQYSWSPSAGLSNPAGANPMASPDSTTTYLVTLTNNICSITDTITVDVSGIIGDTATIKASCIGICNGVAIVTPTLGTPPFTYAWSDSLAQNTQTATGLCSGAYMVTITDTMGCEGVLDIFVPYGPSPAATFSPVNDNLCASECMGSATVNIANATPPLMYVWGSSTGNQTDTTATALCSGKHFITVTDINGCKAIDSVDITEPPPIASVFSLLCNGNCDNSSGIAVTGGVPPYTYLWPSGSTASSDTGLCTGFYPVIVRDSNNCILSDTFLLNSPAMAIYPEDEKCKIPCSGRAEAIISGGTPPFTYVWDDPKLQTDSVADTLCAGTYNLTFTDAIGCIMYASAMVNAPVNLSYAITGLQDIACYGQCNGQATVNPGNGTPPYTYLWDDPLAQNTATGTALCSGSYSVSITDSLKCDVIVPVTITSPAILATTAAGTDNSCFAKCDGEAQATPGGGTLPYTYLWSNAQSTGIINNLCAGDYTVTVYDQNGCTALQAVSISEPQQLLAAITSWYDATCAVICDGNAKVSPAGGTPVYSYYWSDKSGQTAVTATGLCTGDYTVTITDANGCSYTTSQYIAVLSQVPEAGFEIVPDTTSMFDPQVVLYDSSSANVTEWNWDLGDGSTLQENNGYPLPHDFPEPGSYLVTLVVRNILGCPDTAYGYLYVKTDYLFRIPNSFSPNGDGLNDTYFPVVAGINESAFKFYVFSRWGDLIYFTDDRNKPWDGKGNKGKSAVQQDVYIWSVTTIDLAGVEHQYLGRVTLVK